MTTQILDRLDESPPAWDGSAGEHGDTLAWLPLLVGVALLAVVAYAAFDHGAVGLAPGARVEVVVAAIAALAAAGLGGRALRFQASRSALLGLALLAAFAGWCAVTVLWSVAPDQTWVEVNRALSYALVVTLAICLGATHSRAPAWLASGFLAVAVSVSAYALGQKLVPGLHIAGLFDLNQTGSIPRLESPIGYWNALALFAVLGAPLALHFAADRALTSRRRLVAAGGLQLLLLTVGLTLSRGGLLALLVALLVALAGGGERVRRLAWFGLGAVATLPALVLGLTWHPLADAGVALGRRESAGAVLAGVLVLSLAGLLLAGSLLIRHEARLRLAPRHNGWARRAGVAGLVVLVAGGLLAVVLTHAWHNFTSPTAPSNVNPSRLLTTDSYRWLWWKEAANAFSARPLGGWGAGSFGVLHLMYRQNSLPVQQPHSLPLQFLSETGMVGALLGVGALTLVLVAAVRSARRSARNQTERRLALALLASAAAYLVHSLYDWDWNIPAVTVPALMFLGVLAGAERGRVVSVAARNAVREPAGLGARTLALTVATLWLSLFAVSAVLPSLAASRASAALVEASDGSLRAAQADAEAADTLDPLSDAGLRAEASIAVHRGELARARYDLETALDRRPSDELAWNQLASVDYFLGDRRGAEIAAGRVVRLDPRGLDAQALRHAHLAG